MLAPARLLGWLPLWVSIIEVVIIHSDQVFRAPFRRLTGQAASPLLPSQSHDLNRFLGVLTIHRFRPRLPTDL
jgi:hypothetical protein